MDHYFPCFAWSEKLALRDEDLSPADRAALATHVQQCVACAAVQADYHFLDAQLRALPSPLLQWEPLVVSSQNNLPNGLVTSPCQSPAERKSIKRIIE
jgi:anti-sigma factor RsiW